MDFHTVFAPESQGNAKWNFLDMVLPRKAHQKSHFFLLLAKYAEVYLKTHKLL